MTQASKPTMAKQYRVLLSTSHESNAKVFVVAEGAGRAGQAVRIKAEQGARYELQDDSKGKGLAPDQVRAKRMGKNLGLMFDRSQSVDVVIEGYYDAAAGAQASVVGVAENGEMYSYVPHDPEVGSLINNLGDGGVPVQMSLGGDAVAGFELAGLPVVAAGGVSGWAVAGGAAAAGAAGGGGGGGGGGTSSTPTPTPEPTPPTPENPNVNATVAIAAISEDTSAASSGLGSTTDFITKDNTLSYSGTLSGFTANGSKVRVVLKNSMGEQVATADVDPVLGSNGNATWVWNDEATSRADGKYTLTATLVDVDGAVIKADASVSQEVWISANGLTAQDDAGAAKEAGGLNNDVAGQDATGNVLTNDSAMSGLGKKAVAKTNAVGAYGTLNLAEDGSYTYVVNNSDATVNALKGSVGQTPAQTLVDTFSYTVVDSTGLTKTATLSITIEGVTDTNPNVNATVAIAAISEDTSASSGLGSTTDFITKDNTLSYSGTLSGFTANGSKVRVVLKNSMGEQVATADVDPVLGSNGNATWVWNDEATSRADGKYTLTATLVDVDGAVIKADASVSQEVWISANGLTAQDDAGAAKEAGGLNNDVAGQNATGNVLTNDSAMSGLGKKAVAKTNAVGAYGTLNLAEDGSYTYVVNNNDATVNALKGSVGQTPAQTLVDTFSYTVVDSTGLTKTATLSITIEGVTDTNPNVNATVAIAAISEDTSASNGLGSTTDFITKDNTLSYSGTLSGFTANGSKVRVVLKNSMGEQVATADVDPVLGSNGNATWVWNDEATSRADGKYTLTATLVDVDGAVIKADASVSQEVWISANGLTAQDDVGAAKEAGGLNNDVAGQNATGNVLTNDSAMSGLGKKAVAKTNAVGAYGTLNLAEDGSYTYVVNNNDATVNALKGSVGQTPAQTLVDTFSYTVVDSTGLTKTATLSITIEGVTDTNPNVNATVAIAAISEDTSASNGLGSTTDFITKDNTLSYSGTLSGFTANGSKVRVVLKNSMGEQVATADVDPVLGSNGNATWVWNDEATSRADGKYTLTATLVDVDGAVIKADASVSQEVWISANGLTAQDDVGAAKEAGGLNNDVAGQNATGNVLTNDSAMSGLGKKAVAKTNAVGAYGTLNLAEDGSYTYVVNNNDATVNALKGSVGQTPAQTLVDTFSYTVVDSTGLTKTATLNITIQGANDTALFDGLYVLDMRKTATLPSIASLGVSDIDTNESSFVVPDPLMGAYGDFSFTANTWSYGVVASRAAVVDASAEYHDILVVTSLDGSATKTLDVKVLSDVASAAGVPKVFNLLNTEGVTVEGGAGMSDKLVLLGAGQTLDLTKVITDTTMRVNHIERVDLTGSGNNTVKLNLASLTQADVGSDGVHKLYIDGNSGDSVQLGHVSVQADSSVQGYNRYVLDATHELLISQAIASITTS